LGMTTIWVNHDVEADSGGEEPFIDHEIADLSGWLCALHAIERTI
jgi:hypothetical protein